MKKVLLTLTAFIATLTASAQWTASFEPVNDATELKGIHTTTATDGSVYVSSSYNQGFSFAGKDVTDPEGLTSACIVKYDAEGKELWAVTFEGAATVYALDTDTDGTLYIAGNFTDVVKYTGTDGVVAEMTCNEMTHSAFIARISTDGKFEAMKNITPVANEDIAASEFPFYLGDPLYITPNKIQVNGDNVYVSAKYMGDVTELGWAGSYLLVEFMMYMDNHSMGVFSLNKKDLTGAANVANVQMTGVIAEIQCYPETMSFVADNGTVHVGFVGFGNLTLTTANGTEDFTFGNTEEGTEHPFVLATIGETTTTKTFTAKHNKMYVPYNLFMEVNGDNLIIGGTYHGELPLNTEITTGELNSDIFVASVKKADNEVNWTYTSETESEAICMTINNENAFVASTVANYNVDLTTGEGTTATISETLCSADGTTNVYVNESKVYVSSATSTETGIENTVVNTTNGIRYNLAGQAVTDSYKGIVIIDGKKYVVK